MIVFSEMYIKKCMAEMDFVEMVYLQVLKRHFKETETGPFTMCKYDYN